MPTTFVDQHGEMRPLGELPDSIAKEVAWQLDPFDRSLRVLETVLDHLEAGKPIAGVSTHELSLTMIGDCKAVAGVLEAVSMVIGERRKRCIGVFARIEQLAKKGS